uniref:Putative secreted protein n=1 Tax=Xenopsylla cheopis TaxID=163159 RepID=A0A6M2E3C0_XENCH
MTRLLVLIFMTLCNQMWKGSSMTQLIQIFWNQIFILVMFSLCKVKVIAKMFQIHVVVQVRVVCRFYLVLRAVQLYQHYMKI